jgi:NADP-dependent 3-hydroxy acid dehydrogenase YdfG
MMKILLPKLLEKKGGVIVNLSSSAAEMNPHIFSVYNATKVIFSMELVIRHLHSPIPEMGLFFFATKSNH